MDIFAHALWAGAGAKGLNKRAGKRRVNVWAMALWGVFPDLFAFSIPFIWIMGSIVFGGHHFADFGGRPPIAEPTNPDALALSNLSHVLYNVSHSLIIFSAVFIAVWVYFKQVRLELIGWLMHILMDVPTHTYAFFPTPVFWPIFDWKFNGISWGVTWFMVLNYSCLLLAYALLARKRKV
ncbi:MAG: hypothetical protein WAZ40_02425 [Minisyncoccia bacterium]